MAPGGNIGFGNAAHDPTPDGYTILLATNAFSVNVSLYNKIPYDPLKDFVGVSELATSPNTFVVKSDLPAKTMKEFVALAQGQSGKIQLRNTADRNHAANSTRGSQNPGEASRSWKTWSSKAAATPFRRSLERHRAVELWLAAAGCAAHQGRHAPLSRGHG